MKRRTLQRALRKKKQLDAAVKRDRVRADLAARALAAANRLERDRTLLRLGTHVEKAGLLGLDHEALLGAAMLLAPFYRRPERIEVWKRRGAALLRNEELGRKSPSALSGSSKLSATERRRLNHERIKKGAALDKAGIGHWGADILRGALAQLADLALRPGETDRWRAVAARSPAATAITIELRFPVPILPEVSAALRRLGFAFDRDRLAWRRTENSTVLKVSAARRSEEPWIESRSEKLTKFASADPPVGRR
jgi:hypothetical protein